MHQRRHFGPADPTWDSLEAQWMADVAVQGPASRTASTSLFAAYDKLLIRRLERRGIRDQAEDVAQEIWMDVVRAAPRHDPQRQPVRIFLNGFVRLAVTRYFSNLKGALPTVSDADEVVSAEVETAMRSMLDWRSDISITLDLLRCVRRALARFARGHAQYALLLELRHMHDWSLERTARELGSTANQVKARTHAARGLFEPFVRACNELWPDAKARRT